MSADWEAGPRHPPLPADEVHVWGASLVDGRDSVSALPPRERTRAERLRPGAREPWAAARWALRRTLARYLDAEASAIGLRVGEHGKPALAGPSRLRFNLSHSGDFALVAICSEREVGVDIEATVPRRNFVRLAKLGLDADVAAAVGAAPPSARSGLFYSAWVRREAIAKCLGVGLGVPLPDSEVAVAPLDAGPGRAAAVAVAGAGEPLSVRHFSLQGK